MRTYVERDGKPGVWFLSLDATNPLAVWTARRFFHLPYFRAQMSCVERAGSIEYRSERVDAHFEASYGPISDVLRSAPGTLDHWLTERYCLYAQDRDAALWRNEVHHRLWPLQRAKVHIRENTMLEFHGLKVTGPPLVHFARRIDAVVWPGERLGDLAVSDEGTLDRDAGS